MVVSTTFLICLTSFGPEIAPCPLTWVTYRVTHTIIDCFDNTLRTILLLKIVHGKLRKGIKKVMELKSWNLKVQK